RQTLRPLQQLSLARRQSQGAQNSLLQPQYPRQVSISCDSGLFIGPDVGNIQLKFSTLQGPDAILVSLVRLRLVVRALLFYVLTTDHREEIVKVSPHWVV